MLEEEKEIQKYVRNQLRIAQMGIAEEKLTHSPSELSGCARKLWYIWTSAPAKEGWNEYMEVAEEGTTCHNLIIDWFKRAGIWAGDGLRLSSKKFFMRGYMDLRIRWKDALYPVEIKTVKSEAYDKLLAAYGHNEDYEIQLNCYLFITGYNAGFLLYFDRNNARWTMFRYPRNDDLWHETVEKIELVNYYVSINECPERGYNKDDPIHGYKCSPIFCPYRKICYGE